MTPLWEIGSVDWILDETNTTAFTPTADYHPATKKYVDDNSWWAESTQTVVTAWEDVSAWDAIIYMWPNLITQTDWDWWVSTLDNVFWYSTDYAYQRQTFTLTETLNNPIITLSLIKVLSPTDTTTVWIYRTSDDVLVTDEVTISSASISSSFANYDFSLTWNLTLLTPEAYYIRTSSLLLSTSNYITWESSSVDTAYTWWTGSVWTSAWAWTANSTDHKFNISYLWDVRYWKSDASDLEKLNFVWFANETATSWNTFNLNTAWTDTNQSWLILWSEYYLSDTAWAISTTAWTNVVKVGRALSATEIELYTWWKEVNYPKNIYESTQNTWASNSAFSFTHNLWLTEADVENGRYKVVLVWNYWTNRGCQMWDAVYIANVWTTTTNMNNFWDAATPSNAAHVYHQANVFSMYLWSWWNSFNFKCIIQQMY